MSNKINFSILITGSPSESSAPYTAYRFCEEVLAKGHEVSQVFFYQSAVTIANTLVATPQDEFDALAEWVKLAKTNNIDLICCISAAEQRGVIAAEQKAELGKDSHNLHPYFKIGGLGVYYQASLSADRTVTFR